MIWLLLKSEKQSNSMFRGHQAEISVLVIALLVGLTTMLKVGDLQVLSLLKSQGFWKIVAIVLALVNLKNLPFVWHVSP